MNDSAAAQDALIDLYRWNLAVQGLFDDEFRRQHPSGLKTRQDDRFATVHLGNFGHALRARVWKHIEEDRLPEDVLEIFSDAHRLDTLFVRIAGEVFRRNDAVWRMTEGHSH